jgi:glucosamine-6-phosphate deaminase
MAPCAYGVWVHRIDMEQKVFLTQTALGAAAARQAAGLLNTAIARRGQAVFVAATGASQFDFLAALVTQDVDWSRTVMFHLDEYIGLSASHPASFRRYLRERLVARVNPGEVNWIHGEAANPQTECRRLNRLISAYAIDVAFVGIGENGHLAFNDPPADFETEAPYILVDLDDACRQQQLGEGWFSSLEVVPRRAISMSIRQILRAEAILCIVPERRKAKAVYNTLCLEISPFYPASILRQHPNTTLFLDTESAALLPPPG